MNTIQSAGGPLICIDKGLSTIWFGTEGSSLLIGNSARPLSDYDRACASDDYISQIDVADALALVLGDMPLETGVWKSADGFSAIVRFYYKDPETDPLQILNQSKKLDMTDAVEEMAISLRCGDLIIFDSAIPGANIGGAFLPFDLPAGNYRVLTKRMEPDDRTSILVHQFRPVG